MQREHNIFHQKRVFFPAIIHLLYDYEKSLESYLRNVKQKFSENSESGFVATYDDTTVEHHSLASNQSNGFDSIYRSIEEQVSSGLDTDLFILGRSYSVTEAYAKIAGKLFLLKLKNLRHPVKRFLEKAFELHLRGLGFRFEEVKANWGEGISFDPEKDAQVKKTNEETEGVRIQNVLAKLTAGLIDRDTAAKELGYEKAAKENKSKLEEIFSHEIICECGNLNKFVELSVWSEKEKKIYQALEDSFAETFFSTYEERVKAFIRKVKLLDISKKNAIKFIVSEMESELGIQFPRKIEKEFIRTIEKSWDLGQDYQNPNKKENPPKSDFNKEVIDFHKNVLKTDVGGQFKNNKNDFESAITEALKTGKINDVIETLEKKLLGKAPSGGIDPNKSLRGKLNYIIRDNILRARNFSRIERYHSTGITRLEIIAIIDQKTSHICKAMNGKTVSVEKSLEYVKEFYSDDPTEPDSGMTAKTQPNLKLKL